jgi:glutamate-1-semialdehyde 2,1-aminomutase
MTETYDLTRSRELYARAKTVIPGGLVSRIRMRENLPVFTKGAGSRIFDEDGNEYVDTVLAHGPVLLGHAHPSVNRAVTESISRATLFGGATRAEADLAERALTFLPWADKVQFMTTGTEAVQLALRVARAATSRDIIVKFDGHFHGWIDPVYANIPGYEPKAPPRADGEGYAPLAVRPAVRAATETGGLLVSRWGDLPHFRGLMDLYGSRVAAVIMEPLLTGYGSFRPDPAYLDGLMSITRAHGALVVFDDIVTGFRAARGGSAELLGATPDIGIYAKAIANGFPVSMIASSDRIMEVLADGSVPAAGTYSGAPHALAAALASLEVIDSTSGFYHRMREIGENLARGLEEQGRELGVPIATNQVGGVVQVLVDAVGDPNTIDGVYTSDLPLVANVMEGMIQRGVFTSRKGLFYLSAAHSDADIQRVVDTFGVSLRECTRASAGRAL